MNVKVYNQSGEEVGEMELPKVFELPWNADLVHQVVTSQMANARRPIAHTKDRGEVRGGGRKPWRQKGTGRARHGSIRSPLWRGGGVTHGPSAERKFKKKVNKKMARKALLTVLAAKARAKELIIMDALAFPEAKTREAARVFRQFAKREDFRTITKGNGVLVALPGKDAGARRALKNLPYVGVGEARSLSASELLQYTYILFPQRSFEVFAK